MHVSDSIGNSAMDQPVAAISEEVQAILQRLLGVRNLLTRDLNVLSELKKMVNQELRNTDLASRFIDRYQNSSQPKPPATYLDAYASYFASFADDLERRMQMYRQTMNEIELNVRNTMNSTARDTPQVIEQTLRDQYATFMAVASRVSHLDDEISRERQSFEKFQQKYQLKYYGA
eukprot:jgi/Hompol1/5280/HPOL_004303-RA